MSEILAEQIKQLADSLSNKYSRSIIISSKESDIRTRFPTRIELDPNRNYEAGLIWFSAYNTIFNIDKSNNKFIYSNDNGKTWKTLTLSPGAYEYMQLDSEIKRLMIANDDWDKTNKTYNISIDVNKSTGQSIININNPSYSVDFTEAGTIRTLLGFNSIKLGNGYNASNTIVQITNLATINIECSLVEGSYFNGNLGNILYSFPAYTVPVGYKIFERIYVPIYLPVSLKNISEIRTKIIDEDGKLIDFNGEEISLFIHLRQV